MSPNFPEKSFYEKYISIVVIVLNRNRPLLRDLIPVFHMTEKAPPPPPPPEKKCIVVI